MFCQGLYDQEGQAGVGRIKGVLAFAKDYGPARVDEARFASVPLDEREPTGYGCEFIARRNLGGPEDICECAAQDRQQRRAAGQEDTIDFYGGDVRLIEDLAYAGLNLFDVIGDPTLELRSSDCAADVRGRIGEHEISRFVDG